MKTWVGIGAILAATAIVAAVLVARDDEPDAVRAKVEDDGGLTLVGEGDARTGPLDIRTGEHSVVAVCEEGEPFALSLIDGGTSERLLSHTGLVSVRIPRGAVLDVDCAARWGVVIGDPVRLP